MRPLADTLYAMSAAWSWQLVVADGSVVAEHALQPGTFPSQAEAESWLGEAWRDLAEQGIDAVTLIHGEEVVYGPMSLHG